MSKNDYNNHSQLITFMHHIYEYKKGVRKLVLCTTDITCANLVIEKLKVNKINYLLQKVSNNKVNLFFGDKYCLRVIKPLLNKKLNQFSAEEDFILGIMLGYDLTEQCKRLIKFRQLT
ncbi:MAG: DUF2023 family protein [Bacteroidales bacterium]|jgi:hypothetical protein